MALTDRQGRERQMLVKAHLLPVDGQTMLLAGYLDITKQRAAVMASIGEYREMVDSANDTILLVEHNRIIECNPAAEQLFGRSRAELIGQHPGDLSPPFEEGGLRPWSWPSSAWPMRCPGCVAVFCGAICAPMAASSRPR